MKISAEFYQKRLDASPDNPQKAVWDGTQEQWDQVREESIEVCHKYIVPGDSVLDAGCGIGELVECLPQRIIYLGVDFCLGFIEVAKTRYPGYSFQVCNLLDLSEIASNSFDWAVCRTVEGVAKNQEKDAWGKITKELLRIAGKLLVFRAMLEPRETLSTVEVLLS